MTTTFIVEWDYENLPTLVLAITDMKHKVRELQQIADKLAVKLLQEEE